MTHIHDVYDSDRHFSIDKDTRQLKNMNTDKNCIMQHDHNSERITFDLPRKIDGHDMSTCNVVEVHFINTDARTKEQNPGIYPVADLRVSPTDPDTVICSWLVSIAATKLVGPLAFRLTFKCSADGDVDYAWSTAIFKDYRVSDGINNTEIAAEEYNDLLAQWQEIITKSAVAASVAASAQAQAGAEAAKAAAETARDEAVAAGQNASISAQAAATSEQNAKTSESNAATSEQNAKTAETNAKNSEEEAKASEQNAAKSAQEAQNAAATAKGVDVTAQPGQLIRVKAVDADGKPTAWEPVPWGYTEDGMVELLPESKPFFDENEGTFLLMNDAPALSVGVTYVVNWNGTEYTCVGQDASTINPDVVLLGNGFPFGLPNTGEPFVMIGAYEEFYFIAILPLDGTTDLTISIKGAGEVVHKLPGKFLPEGVPYVEQGVPVELLPESQMTFMEEEGTFALFTCPEVVDGGNYIINWNGVEYACTAVLTDPEDGLCFCGNLGMMMPDEYEDTGEPFLVGFFPGEMTMAMPLDGSTEVTLSVKEANVTIQKMDMRCVPDDVSRVKYYDVDFEIQIINSVTTASTTKTFAEIYAKAMEQDTIVRGVYKTAQAALYFTPEQVTVDKVIFCGYTTIFGNLELFCITVNADNSVELVRKTI